VTALRILFDVKKFIDHILRDSEFIFYILLFNRWKTRI